MSDTFDDMPIGISCAPDGGGCAYEYIAGERWCGQPEGASIHHVTQTYSHGFVPVPEQSTKATDGDALAGVCAELVKALKTIERVEQLAARGSKASITVLELRKALYGDE